MTTPRLIVLGVIAFASVARATPSEEELAPITIPASDPAQTDLAKRLSGSCKLLNKTPILEARTKLLEANKKSVRDVFSLKGVEKIETKPTDEQVQRLNGMNEACQAVSGNGQFTDEILASLRNYRDSPEATAFVRTVLNAPDGAQQSDITPPALSSGSLYGYLIEGFVKFIYNRAKAEAIGYLTEKLKGILCAPARKPFFRNVCTVFEEIDPTIPIQAIGSHLAAAARRDIQNLPDVLLVYGLHAVTKDGKCVANSDVDCEAMVAGRVGLAFYEELRQGRAALDTVRALHRVEFTPLQKAAAPNTAKAIRWASAIVDAVLKQDGWDQVKPSKADPLKSELPYYAIATVLTVETLLGETIGVDAYNKFGLLGRVPKLFGRAKEILDRIKSVMDSLDALRKSASGDKFDEDNADGPPQSGSKLTTRDYLAASTRALAFAVEIAAEMHEPLGLSADQIAKLTKIAHLGELLATGTGLQEISIEVGELFVLLVGKREIPGLSTTINKVLPFVSQLATAKSADEVAKVFEAAAAPVGTYKEKSKKRMTTINAFVGVAGGAEYIPDTPWASQIGVFSPVGLHVSWPWCGNWGVMFSLINLGSLVSQRFNEAEEVRGVEVAPEQSDAIEKLFSPGVFVTKSIAGPFTIGAGVQYVPSARDVTEMVTATESSTSTRSAVQPLVFLGIDVSIFPF